MAVSTMLR